MGEAVEKLSGKLGVDTTDFKTGIAAANRELRVLESGFKASVSSMADWSKTSTGLETRIKSLTDQIDIQKLKVDALRENYQKMAAENGENSKAAQDAEIALNKQVEVLGKMESELSTSEQALNDLSQAEDETGSSADEAGGKVKSFSDVLGGIGSVVSGAVKLVSGLALAVAGVGTAIGGLVFSTAEASGELSDLSSKTGFSTDQLQEMSFIGNQLGVSLDTIVGAQSKLIRSMSGAQGQYADYAKAQADAAAKGEEFDGKLGDSAAAFDALGIKVLDANGNLRSSQNVYAETIDALGKIKNPAERDAMAMSIFGKSAMELNPLINTGSDGMAEMAKKAHELGAVVSEETVAKFDKFGDTVDGLKDGLKGVLGELAGAFLPGFQMIFDQAGGYLQQFKGIVDGSGGDIGKIAAGVGDLISTIISDVAAQIPQLMETGMTILMSIVDAILQNLPMMISTGVELLLKLVDGLVTALPTLVQAALQAIVALANGLTQALPTLIPTIVQVILTIVQILVENLPMIIDAALQLILALAQGLIAAIPILIPAIPTIVQAILDAFIQALPMIITAATQLVNALALGLLQNIPLILTAAVQLIAVIVGYLYKDAPKMMWDAGSNLIKGMWEGIKNNFGWLKENFVAEMMKVVAAVKNAMGIHSPSALFADQIGENMPLGIGEGWDQSMPAVRNHLAKSMLGLTNDLQTTISAPGMTATAGAGVGAASISFGDIYINVPGTSATPQQVAAAAQDGLLKALRSKGVN